MRRRRSRSVERVFFGPRMTVTVCIRVVSSGSGWTVEIGDGRTRPSSGSLGAAAVSATVEKIQELLGHVPSVLIPGRDQERSAAEEKAGRLLGGLLWGLPHVAARLSFHMGEASGGEGALVVVVDAVGDARSLPWELLALSAGAACAEASGQATIVRMATGARRPKLDPRRRVRTVVWCPTPDDSACATVLSRLSSRQGCEVVPLSELADDGAVDVLHLVCHAERVADEVRVLAGADQSVATTAHALLEPLRRAVLVILDVCEAGSATPDELANLAGRLLMAGARAVVAPTRRTSVEALGRFEDGLYAALFDSRSVTQAVAVGRAEVRALALAHPDSRWDVFGLHVADLDVVRGRAPLLRDGGPPGWPPAGDDARAVVDAAWGLAETAGYLGIEHLATAVGLVGAVGPGSARLRVEAGRAEVDEVRARLSRRADLAGEVRATPRLERVAQELPAGFGLERLASGVFAGVHEELSYVTSEQTLVEPEPAELASVPTVLEVIFGPEDGRRLQPEAGQVIGRWADARDAHICLYEATVLVDRRLSRRHLMWLGAGRVDLLRPGWLRRGAEERPVRGEIVLLHGDVLMLSRATRFLALHEDSCGAT